MLELFSYNTTELSISYHLKWTILHHIKYIVNKNKIFEDDFPDGLDVSHFYDALSGSYANLPAFGVDYLGKRVVGDILEDLYMLRYVGKTVSIIPTNRYGVMTENGRLLKLHDHLFYNFERLGRSNELIVYKFLDENLDPQLTQIGFTMELLDSIPTADEKTHARVNQFEMTFGVKINM